VLPPRAPSAHELAEQIVEHVGEGRGEVEARRSAPAHALLERRVAEAIVSRTLLVVLQDVIGFVDFLELDLGGVVAGVAVGMAFHRQLAVAGLQLGGGGALLAAECLVVAALAHGETITHASLKKEPGAATRRALFVWPGGYAAPFLFSSSTSENSASTTLSS